MLVEGFVARILVRTSALQGGKEPGQEFPVIFGRKDDGLPDGLSLRGEIAKVGVFTRDGCFGALLLA